MAICFCKGVKHHQFCNATGKISDIVILNVSLTKLHFVHCATFVKVNLLMVDVFPAGHSITWQIQYLKRKQIIMTSFEETDTVLDLPFSLWKPFFSN